MRRINTLLGISPTRRMAQDDSLRAPSCPQLGGLLFGIWIVLVVSGVLTPVGSDASEPVYPARYEACAGWGVCTFYLTPPVPTLGDRVQVRLRGVGDPALAGTCNPEREAARTIRTFVEGILTRASRIELSHIEPLPGRTAIAGAPRQVLATVQVDGTDLVEILVHIGLGREKPMRADSKWCD